MNPHYLHNKNALVCGSSQGIGAACAKALASLGATITCVARNGQQLKTLLEQLPGEGHKFVVCDFSSPQQVTDLCNTVADQEIDILVNNSGGPLPKSAQAASAEEYQEAFQSHLLTFSALSNATIPNMKDKKWGRIVNIISVSGKTPVPNLAVSNSIRGAVINWSKTLSYELAASGITVNNVLPGYTRTPRLSQLNELSAKISGRSVSEVEAGLISQIPMARFGEPFEIAAAVAFFASPSASFITGTSLAVDGGWSRFS